MKEYYNERNLKKLVPLNERLQMIASANSDGREWGVVGTILVNTTNGNLTMSVQWKLVQMMTL